MTGHGPRERHWRMARNQEFDVCEFNVGAYLMARDHGDSLAAIPVFLHRRFRHGFAFVNVNSSIKSPKDLIGQRVGGTNFQPAGNIWLRGIFEQHYGVPHRVDHLAGRSQRRRSVHPAGGIEDRNDSRRQIDGHHARRRRDPGNDQSLHSPAHGRRRQAGGAFVSRLQNGRAASIFSTPVFSRSCM